ncbi:hypothetical protein [Nocardioides sp. REDSEA-S30_B4]|uniref:hypothetical protein n=1 Tax=Nocardioides sp. REDSEA-S30_B4 TaxID=1811552 RepID=UPI000A9625F8|nr:hypothetical protein [Nocardioides sp. REDSEA-S30_B4]
MDRSARGRLLAVAAVAGSVIEVVQRRIERLRLPFFYSQVAGALVGTLIARPSAGG